MIFLRLRSLIFAAAISLVAVGLAGASNEPAFSQAPAANETKLTEEQMRQFLATAKVVKSTQTKKGITNPYRLTLTDGTFTHDSSFQAVDEARTIQQFANGGTELNFRDSFHFNIAAYELAKLLGLDHMMPVTVQRRWEGKTGSLTWWLPVKMDEADRIKRKIQAPDPDAWNKQMYRMRVFSQLVYDTDRNLTNVLIGEDWKLYMIDFSRAFRLRNELENPKNLVKCDRQLLEKLRRLNAAEVEQKTKDHLRPSEVKALMARRDKIVAYFEQLIAQQGENAVLY
jgi:hypothetical protein